MGRRHIENYIGEYVLYTPPVQPQLAVLVAYEGRPHEAGKYTIQLVKGGEIMELKAATYKERVTMTGISSVEAEPEPITLTNEELMKLVKERMG